MRREDKYPETKSFKFYNRNPKGRFTGDCMTRAVSLATGMDYGLALLGIAAWEAKTCESDGYAPLLESIGWRKQKQPRKENGKKYTGAEFCRWLDAHGFKGGVVAHIGGHHMVAIMPTESGYKVHDIWDSTGGTIGNWWVKD